MPIDIEVTGLLETQRKMTQVARDLYGAPMVDAFRQAALLITRDARINAPVDTGRLRSSIVPDVIADETMIQGVVGSNVEYAPHMEFGTGAFGRGGSHWPPGAALQVWAERHGFSSGYAVAAIIGKRGGLEGRRFLTRAFEANEAAIIEHIEQAVKGIVDE